MDYSLILSNITKHINLYKEEEEYFISLLHYKRVKKRQYLLEEGEVNTKLTFVTQGCLRSYAVDKNGGEHVLQFAPPNWWIVDMRSFIKQEPARLNIDAIEDSEVIYIMKTDMDELQIQVPKFERFGRILAQNAMASYQHRQIDNVTLSAIERYTSFCHLYPSLILTLPQKQVASYIGVTPEFLSKMLNTVVIK
ncbi:Crp/Fnr family transcriptional regulator [Mucilaginibacter segetis]|uniref:Crp/Fnr family transcriptional regulator n=1 Tax=Mucilaginibacter segetis TaxID=2793071 RepID=A0A934PT85_9SPHI|nr:Crp/Fnr family transcriptional regulator [Mucilaginibacter segetis]MBK0378746.1 Crp/Fnr family transcriptional regulator [Mucilaginibacter segetis]